MKKLLLISCLLIFELTTFSAVNKSCQDKLITTDGDTIICTIMFINKRSVTYLACPNEANNWDNSDHKIDRSLLSDIITDRKIFQPKVKTEREPREKERKRINPVVIPSIAVALATTSWMFFLLVNWGVIF